MNNIISMPTNISQWVVPATIDYNGVTYRLWEFSPGQLNLPGNMPLPATITEVVFPKYLSSCNHTNSPFPNLRKVTFGEYFSFTNVGSFQNCPVDTVIFLGVRMFTSNGNVNGSGVWVNNPANTVVIVPCNTKEKFVNSLSFGRWYNWTATNFVEAPCLNTLTVLSNDVSRGNAVSLSGGQVLTTTTPVNTSTTFSGTATLYALPQKDKVFTGWSDGDIDNRRTVTVNSDTTFTANFGICTPTGIEEMPPAPSPLKVYPNPAKNILNVEAEYHLNKATLALFDMNGKIVLSKEINGNTAQINIANLAVGNYILRVIDNGTASTGVKVIKE
jgi:hypothetical protein